MKLRTTNYANFVNTGTAVIVVMAMAKLFSEPLRAHADLLPYAQDDFYYYLVVARNLAHGLGSTFDGTTLTNGYHPLYLVMLWGVCHFVSSLRGIFKFLAVLDTVSAAAIFLTARALFARRLESVWWANGFALVMLCVCYGKLCNQMEITLTMPLALFFLLLLDRAPEQLSPRAWAGVGLVAALLILSRLDAALLVGLCGLAALLQPDYRRVLSREKVAAFFVGFAPLSVIYLVVNELVFHRLTPISAAAKQLKTGHRFAFKVLLVSPSSGTKGLFALALVGLWLLPRIWGRLPKEQRMIYSAALLFPFLHWGMNLTVSDWQLWPWYSYSPRIALVAVLAMTGSAVNTWYPARWRTLDSGLTFAAALLLVVSRHYQIGDFMVDIAGAARGIQAFAQAHPGRYAMGDRAGMVGYIDGAPTLQMEGLMMDDGYLAHLRRQEPLRDVLRLYHVEYYVGFDEKLGEDWKPGTGCFQAKEPAKAGPRSLTMRGQFCEPPVWNYLAPSGHTMIFDLRGK